MVFLIHISALLLAIVGGGEGVLIHISVMPTMGGLPDTHALLLAIVGGGGGGGS